MSLCGAHASCVQVVDIRRGLVGGRWTCSACDQCGGSQEVVSPADTGEKTAKATLMLCNTDKELGNSGHELSNADGLTRPPAEEEQDMQFLVKWAGQSHIHNTWESGELWNGVGGVEWGGVRNGCWWVG